MGRYCKDLSPSFKDNLRLYIPESAVHSGIRLHQRGILMTFRHLPRGGRKLCSAADSLREGENIARVIPLLYPF